MDKLFDKLIVCMDMAGCPNRCRHCWLGHTPNRTMPLTELERIAALFRPYADKMEVEGWYREPDYRDDYKELWALEESLSDDKLPHFELMSYWRAARDESYIPWLQERGIKATQMTFFGGRDMTDKYVQRKGAYDEMVSLIPRLVEYGIIPRFQVFVNKENIGEMEHIVRLAEETGLAKHPDFHAFVHAGGCDGANEALYDIRITPEDLEKIPQKLKDWTKQHLGKSLEEFSGQTEQNLYREMVNEDVPLGYEVPAQPVLYIDHEYNVFPNLTAPQPAWCYGNLRKEAAPTILQRVTEGDTHAMRVMRNVPVCELVRTCGDESSLRLFDRGDYETYLLNRYTRTYSYVKSRRSCRMSVCFVLCAF